MPSALAVEAVSSLASGNVSRYRPRTFGLRGPRQHRGEIGDQEVRSLASNTRARGVELPTHGRRERRSPAGGMIAQGSAGADCLGGRFS
jgi:hypothetical protein